MRTIFIKLFMWFWLSTILSGAVFFLIAFNLRLSPLRDEHRRHMELQQQEVLGQALAIYGSTAAALSEKQGSTAAVDARQQSERGARPYLFAADGTPISPGVPPLLVAAVRSQLAGAGTPPGELRAVLVRVQGPSGREYLAAAEPHHAPPLPGAPPFRLPPHFWLQLLITLVISAAACYGLSWRLTAPVRRLRAAAQGLAAGDLGSRVQVSPRETGYELNDLGRDFNLMAGRIEKLVLAHKQLVRDASHELRSPLARLNVALGIARKETPHSAAGALDRIEYESDRLNLLITELLTLSKLEEGGEIEKGELDLVRLVEEVARDADFEACAGNRHVRFTSTVQVTLMANRELLSRALENVVRNAVKYTAEETAVEITLEREREEALIMVRDCGPGVPEGQLGDIFRPFYRVAEARDRKSGGTGIGLAIAEKTVALHGGAIAAHNLAEGGLEVEIRLPL
ncbi:HAMP domain-containing protein [Geomonas nitrogeniifigens]|uniref:ATP-binding protein n=1 Tax=Geomonas diazotrophica TaxID=2843197 RepID=UPI001C2BF9E4|nr:ATP-binding protein [Geomonas nitrogeniifigens]QXE85948.1 HAMP domain-containing protein [Geomonas nitrogeniifigens]